MNAKKMHIHLNGLKLYAFHGVLPQENVVGAYYIINLDITTIFTLAAETDNLDGTINYADIYQSVKREMAIPSKLLENVAYRICSRLMDEFEKIEEISICINKENPPMESECQEVGIEATYVR